MTKTFEILNFGNCNLFDICVLGFGIFSIKELVWTKICHTTFVTFLWDTTLEPISKMRLSAQGCVVP
jgi:hypothetical protein